MFYEQGLKQERKGNLSAVEKVGPSDFIPSSVDPYSVVSFFCGCGGLDLGMLGGFKYKGEKFEKLPFHISAAYDNDQKCIDTYGLNMELHAKLLDLSTYSPKEVPAANVLIGGFPCQDFATCGSRRGLSSDRGQLYLAMIKYMEHHKPTVVLGENVPGLENINGGNTLRAIENDIRSVGYRVETWSLFAPDFGVPQRRKRLFIIGVRNDVRGSPEPPPETHLEKPRTIKWAINDLAAVVDESIPNQSQYFKASKAKKGNGQGDEVSKADHPSYTIRANAKSRVQFHYSLDRRLTVRECARLQTFPDSFVFPHAATTNVMQVGNAVPPILAHRVAKCIVDMLGSVVGSDPSGEWEKQST